MGKHCLGRIEDSKRGCRSAGQNIGHYVVNMSDVSCFVRHKRSNDGLPVGVGGGVRGPLCSPSRRPQGALQRPHRVRCAPNPKPNQEQR